MTEANRRLDDARLRAALDTLGIRDPRPDEGGRTDNGVLLGILLALTEIAILHDLTDASAGSLTRGYRWMVDQSLDGDEADSARLRAQLLQDRLHRSAHDVWGERAADSLGLIQVCGPAILAAANLLELLHHHSVTPPRVASSMGAAQISLAQTAGAFAQLRERLLRDGFEV